jgi:hypothetical protein
VRTDRLNSKAAAIACLLAVFFVFALEGIPHRHASATDQRCPACQAARQHIGEAPRLVDSLPAAPESRGFRPADPSVVRLPGPLVASSASPRSPPSAV